MKPIEQMTESELIAFGKAAKELQATIRAWIKEKYWPADKQRQYYLTKCIADFPKLEMAINKARELYKLKFKK